MMPIKVDYKGLGMRIRAYRREQDLTQSQLAENANVSTQFLGNIERGNSIPSIDTLVSLSYALNVSPNTLLSDSLPEGGFYDPETNTLRCGSFVYHTLSDLILAQEEKENVRNSALDATIGLIGLDEDFISRIHNG